MINDEDKKIIDAIDADDPKFKLQIEDIDKLIKMLQEHEYVNKLKELLDKHKDLHHVFDLLTKKYEQKEPYDVELAKFKELYICYSYMRDNPPSTPKYVPFDTSLTYQDHINYKTINDILHLYNILKQN